MEDAPASTRVVSVIVIVGDDDSSAKNHVSCSPRGPPHYISVDPTCATLSVPASTTAGPLNALHPAFPETRPLPNVMVIGASATRV